MITTLNRNSWHHWLWRNAKIGNEAQNEPEDICAYVRGMLGRYLVMWPVLSMIISALILFGVVAPICFIQSIFSTVYYADDVQAFIYIFGFVGICFELGFGVHILWEKYKPDPQLREDGFVKKAWEAHKNKYCVKIKFE